MTNNEERSKEEGEQCLVRQSWPTSLPIPRWLSRLSLCWPDCSARAVGTGLANSQVA